MSLSSTAPGSTDRTTSSTTSTLLSSSTSAAFTSLPTASSVSLSTSISPTLSMDTSTSILPTSSTIITSTLTTSSFTSSSFLNSLTSRVSSSLSISLSSSILPSPTFSISSLSNSPSPTFSISSSLSKASSLSSSSSSSILSSSISNASTTAVSTHTLHTSAESAWTSTFLTTTFIAYTGPHGTATTVSRVSTLVSSESGMLSTGSLNPNSNPFSHHPGAIVGVTVGAIIAVAFSAIWIFLAHRKYTRMQQDARHGSRVTLNASQEGSWRFPFDDAEDDDGVYQTEVEQYPRILAALEPADSQTGGSEIDGDHIDDGDAPNPGVEIAGPRRSSSLGQRPYMPGFGQVAETIAVVRVPVDEGGHIALQRSPSPASIVLATRSRSTSCAPETGCWQVDAEACQGSYGGSPTSPMSSGHSSGHGYEYALGGGSAASLYMYRSPSSSHGHAASSSSAATSVGGRRSSGSKRLSSSHGHGVPHSATAANGRRLSGSTQATSPPTSYKGKRASDTRSLRGFIGRLRRSSNHTIVVTPPRRSQSLTSHMHSPYVYSPSSLLVPQPVGNGNMSQKPSLSLSRCGEQVWPGSGPLTLPPLPSPAVTTDALPVSDGLLDPRLESLASLADHEDYSRPIGAVVHNKIHSTTTFGTQDTVATKLEGDETDS